jgi:hypothetical protein
MGAKSSIEWTDGLSRKTRPGSLRILEADIERTCVEFLQCDGWRALKMEQNRSEKKGKTVGERGMADHLFIRYGKQGAGESFCASVYGVNAQVLFVEFKRLTASGKPTKLSEAQLDWHRMERARGALTIIAGIDFEASIEGFICWYQESGLQHRRFRLKMPCSKDESGVE